MKHREYTTGHKRTANHHFTEQYVYTGDKATETSLQLVQYGPEDIQISEIKDKSVQFSKLQDKHTVNWLQIAGLNDANLITDIVTGLGLDALKAKDILTSQHIVKAEEYHGKIFIILNACRYDENDLIHIEHIGIILAGNTIVTFVESRKDLFAPAMNAIHNDVFSIRSKDSSMLLAFILNAAIAGLVESSSRVEELLEEIEDTLLNISTDQRSVGPLIQQRRREYMIIRKNTQPLREQLSKLIKAENTLISHDALPAFSDLGDQLQYINQTIEGCREIISSLVDLYISNNDLRMNAIMKRLTVVSTLFIPLTFLAGVWGMNFDFMPEIKWHYGYLAAWIIMLLCALSTWLYLRKKDWY